MKNPKKQKSELSRKPRSAISGAATVCRSVRTLFWTEFRNYVLDQVNPVYLDYFASICILVLQFVNSINLDKPHTAK